MKLLELLALTITAGHAATIVQSNDDGWAEKNIRVLNSALVAAGNDVVLSAPAENQSGRSTTVPLPDALTALTFYRLFGSPSTSTHTVLPIQQLSRQ
jgi:broad specificity polyphosphatase/5'/3'-nucleotidase SurE